MPYCKAKGAPRTTARQITALVVLAPVLLPLWMLCRLVEWWHFGPSSAAVSATRAIRRRVGAFFESLGDTK